VGGLRKAWICGLAWAIGFVASWPSFGQVSAAVRKDAERVLRALDRIEAESLMKKGGALKRADFTEDELNAYIAYRIEAEREEVLRELVLKLFAGNRIEGKAFVDLSGARLPFGLKPRMNLYFEGTVVTQEGAVRIQFEKLFVEDQPMPLMLFDMIILAAAAIGKSEAVSINDWYELPYGIKEIKTVPQKVSLYYPP
jgi:hypothetical protein